MRRLFYLPPKSRLDTPPKTMAGQVDSVDAAAGVVVVMGIHISIDAMARFEDHRSLHTQTFSLADVHSGDWLEIRGAPSSVSGNSVAAMRVDRLQPQINVRLSGAVGSLAQPNFTNKCVIQGWAQWQVRRSALSTIVDKLLAA